MSSKKRESVDKQPNKKPSKDYSKKRSIQDHEITPSKKIKYSVIDTHPPPDKKPPKK